jgi:hypothetical protein
MNARHEARRGGTVGHAWPSRGAGRDTPSTPWWRHGHAGVLAQRVVLVRSLPPRSEAESQNSQRVLCQAVTVSIRRCGLIATVLLRFHHAFFIVSPIDPINEIIAGSAIDVDRAHGALLPVPMEEQDGCCCVVGNRIKDKLRARNMVKPRSQTRDRPRLRVQLRSAPTRSGTSIKDTK